MQRRTLTLWLALGLAQPACRWGYGDLVDGTTVRVGDADPIDGGVPSSGTGSVGGGSGTSSTATGPGGPSGGASSGGGSSSSGGEANPTGGVAGGGAPSGGTSTSGNDAGVGSVGGAATPGGSGGQGGSGGVSTGGAGSGGGAGTGGGAGAGGSTTITPDATVTIPDDESNSNASPSAPGGTGFSLREAIAWANRTSGTQVISLGGVMSVLGGDLTSITESVVLMGEGGGLDASADTGSVFYVTASDVQIIDVDIVGGGSPVFFVDGTSGSAFRDSTVTNPTNVLFVEGTGHRIENNTYLGCADDCVSLYGDGHQVRNNRFVDVGSEAIRMSDTAVDAYVVGNVILRANRGIAVNSGATDTRIYHNTIVSSTGYGIAVSGSIRTDIRNNIVAYSGSEAVGGDDGDLSQLDYLLSFQNAGVCSGCSSLPGANVWTDDPLFVDFGADDVSIDTMSAAVDAGSDLGEDRAQGASNYLGNGPDLGAYEVD